MGEGFKRAFKATRESRKMTHPTEQAELKPLQSHEKAIADIQLSEHVLKLLKAYGITVPEEILPDFEMQLCYDMALFRGDFRGHRTPAQQPAEGWRGRLAAQLVEERRAQRDASRNQRR